jgi:hypothetical protein
MSKVIGHSVRRINHLAKALQAKRYLEVGVFEGTTFFDIDIPYKVGVDPNFKFDITDKPGHLYPMTSDAFFTGIEPGDKFDILFLDGLHTHAQTFRDFCSALSLGHDKSVWIIDDTLPSDVFSAIEDHHDRARFRSELGLTSLAWHGDVYKVVFLIHDFFPTLSYVTIRTHGNPQTVVWKQQRKNFKPRFNNLEAISRLSFFDMKKCDDVFNFTNEADGLNAVTNAILGSKTTAQT